VNTTPRRFILQALDPDHGSPVLQASFLVDELDDLRGLLGRCADDDAGLTHSYDLDAADLTAIADRFGAKLDADGRQASLFAWSNSWDIPYLAHTGYELPLMLDGRKQLARFCEEYPPHRHFGEHHFDRYVAQGLLHKEVQIEPYAEPVRLKGGRVMEGFRTVYYARKGEEWRIPASKVIWAAAAKSQWNHDFERMEGMLFGYEEWQNDWWIEQHKRRRGAFGCIAVYRAVAAPDLEWIEAAGGRALPPSADAVLEVFTGERPDREAALRMMDPTAAIALVRLNMPIRLFVELTESQAGPTYIVRSEQIPDVNRHLVGAIEIIERRTASA
jgi:hypothetical protein